MKTTRLTLKQEHEFINNSTNRNNINTLRRVLKYFMLDKSTERYVREKLSISKLNENDLYLDKLFNLNNQRRAFFKINNLSDSESSNINAGYKTYLYRLLYLNECGDINYDIYKKLIKYKTFKSGKIEINNQPRKLFKYLMNKKLFHETLVDEINSRNLHIEDFYICISRNPIDYLMISTNQNYSSCMSLSGYDVLYLGFTGAFVDPNRYLIFFTNKKLHNYELKPNLYVKHFKYSSRSWGLLLRKAENCNFNKIPILHSVRYYPVKIDDHSLINSLCNLQQFNYSEDYNKKVVSYFKFKIPKIKYIDDHCIPYLDSFSILVNDETNIGHYTNCGDITIGASTLYSHNSVKFYYLKNLEELYNIIKCNRCGKFVKKEYECSCGYYVRY